MKETLCDEEDEERNRLDEPDWNTPHIVSLDDEPMDQQEQLPERQDDEPMDQQELLPAGQSGQLENYMNAAFKNGACKIEESDFLVKLEKFAVNKLLNIEYEIKSETVDLT